MSRILVIEPYKLLQHGFTAALFAEHELTIAKTIPETAEGIDLAVIDATALRERGLLSGLEFGVIQGWQVPVIWLDADDQAKVPAVDRFARVRLPLDKESLKQALLAVRVSSKSPNQPTSAESRRSDGPVRKNPRVKQAKTTGDAGESKQNIIELVDVVEEVANHGGQLESLKKE